MEKYIPDIYQKSIYTLDYSKLLSRGIKCILFDLDNTLVGACSDELIPKTKDLIIGLKQKGFKVIIFSNSPKGRVSKFSEMLDVNAVHFACKPFQGKLKKLINETGFKLNEIAIIGDQMMTDILVGNKAGITTILVNPASNKDHILARFSRHSEYRKMKKLRDKDLFCKGRYYD
ncbi:MAG: YqeG family HAD IIIA-type phosphatase [Bacilli bacterium]|nr:YqeG family HAD IIIA-type phosphatase [Bacilli bacterium]